MNVSLNVVLDTRRIKKSNKYPVKLRATFQRVADDYQTIFDLSKDEFGKLEAYRITGNLQMIRDKLRALQRSAQNEAVKLDPFCFEDFEKKFISGHPLFKQRKTKYFAISSQTGGFDYDPFVKRFPILKETIKEGTIRVAYLDYIKKL